MLAIALQEAASGRFVAAESAVAQIVGWIRLVLEATGAVIVTAGAVMTLARMLDSLTRRQSMGFNAIRLGLARYLALALEFQLASDILQTAIAPEWPEIGELAAIAAIRTALNFFLAREMREERELTARRGATT